MWALTPDCAFLNHGSFGATPRAVLAAQAVLRDRMEAQPVRFFVDELPGLLRESANRLATFVGTAADRLVFVENATAGVNAVLRSAALREGDEILTTDHAYGAVRHVIRHVADKAGARATDVTIGMPVEDDAFVLDAIRRAITPRTRIAVIDHIASSSAVRLPIAAIAAICRLNGVRLLVDGAHGPGMTELDIDAIGADWYVGNCHKWMCAPKGTGFIAVAPGAGAGLHPGTISHYYGQGFVAEFDWPGTRDPTGWLAVPAAIDFLAELGIPALRARNRALAAVGAKAVAETFQTELGAAPSLFEIDGNNSASDCWRSCARAAPA